VITPAGHAAPVEADHCPSPSSATAVYSIHSPVAGLKKGRNRKRRRGHGTLVNWRSHFSSASGPRLRYHATVAAMAAASGVPPVPNVDWYLVVSSTKGSSNS
jgi:hypothetical protein